MITQLKIENYKSIQELTLDVGRVNVLIGENGCGKSNILEAITLAAAAETNKLDNEFLINRGIRVTEPELMRSSFDKKYQSDPIKIAIKSIYSDTEETYILENLNQAYSKWKRSEKSYLLYALQKVLSNIENNDNSILGKDRNAVAKEKFIKKLEQKKDYFKNDSRNKLEDYKIITPNFIFRGDFIIYSPENTSLRNFNKETKIEPLGDKGEGLLTLLIYTQHEAKQSQNFSELNDIQETLELFGWFDSIQIPDDFSLLEKKITIKDRFLAMPFDQRSANEGFLLVLFYITLVVSKYTPKIFAIDNIDTSLNPKLCTKLVKELTRLAKKYDKQIFLTSHNPAILDGIDLDDSEQKIIVVYRNDEGHTLCHPLNIEDKPKSVGEARLRRMFKDEPEILAKIEEKFKTSNDSLNLSEAFLRGYLGGLPTGF